MRLRRRYKILAILSVIVISGAIFYFGYPQIWGSAVYPLAYEDLIKKYSAQYNVLPSFVATVIYAESRFNPQATSPVGARGLMQIMPATGARLAKTLGDTDFSTDKLYEPDRNVRYGTYYLHELIDRHQGNMDKALMVYNGGEGAVISFERRGVLPRETEGYLRKIKGTWDMYEKVYADVWYGPGAGEQRQQTNELQEALKKQIESLKGKEEGLIEYKAKKWEFKIFWPPIKKSISNE